MYVNCLITYVLECLHFNTRKTMFASQCFHNCVKLTEREYTHMKARVINQAKNNKTIYLILRTNTE